MNIGASEIVSARTLTNEFLLSYNKAIKVFTVIKLAKQLILIILINL